MRKILGSAVILTAALVSSPALALETGQCLPAAEARQALVAEQMNPIIVGNRGGSGYPTALIYFANSDGSKGYAILSDKPYGEQAARICVQSVYRDVRLNDNTKPGIPKWAILPVDRVRATALCAKGGLGWQDRCVPYDAGLANMERNGSHVMLIATGTAINPRDNSIRADQRIVIAADPTSEKGILTAATVEGASYMLWGYTEIKYTQFGQALLKNAG